MNKVRLNPQQTAEYVQLLTSSQRSLYRYVATLLSSTQDADEVLQNTNLKLWAKSDEYRWDEPFAAWAFHCARFEVLAFRKRRIRQDMQFSTELVEQLAMESLDAEIGRPDDGHALEECLARLAPPDRELITLRYLPEISAQDVAARLNRPVKSIYRSLERIRTLLLECLRQHAAREQK